MGPIVVGLSTGPFERLVSVRRLDRDTLWVVGVRDGHKVTAMLARGYAPYATFSVEAFNGLQRQLEERCGQ